MSKMKYIFVLAVVMLGLVLSGCADKTTTEEQEEVITEISDVSAADTAFSEEGIELTDTEIEDLEAELAEIEALLEEINSEENISIEEI
ncbi:hypothetical protein V7O66_01195 [Methanolobus sp. ZRKC3]|uniref:hypothetical protein n=1 Tax=Methanolobus sp. ZRKC3 TaxID=3125786 RepID=UPI0032463D53